MKFDIAKTHLVVFTKIKAASADPLYTDIIILSVCPTMVAHKNKATVYALHQYHW